MTEFRGRGEWDAYWQAVRSIEGGSVSPGVVSRILQVSRQRVWKLMSQGDLRAWVFYDEGSVQATYTEVSLKDVIRYGVRVGRIKSADDIPLGFPGKQEMVDEVNAEVLT